MMSPLCASRSNISNVTLTAQGRKLKKGEHFVLSQSVLRFGRGAKFKVDNHMVSMIGITDLLNQSNHS